MLLDLVILGLGITLEPLPITGFILVLSSERGIFKGLAFIMGWLASLFVVIALVVLATGGKPLLPQTAPSTGILAGKIALGVLLILIGANRQRTRGRPRKPPTWMARLDHLSGWTAFVLAMFLQPWVLVAAGAATFAQGDITGLAGALTLVGFCVLSTASLLALELYATFSPAAAQARLGALRRWMDRHRDQVIVVLSLAVGFWLVAHSIYQLVA